MNVKYVHTVLQITTSQTKEEFIFDPSAAQFGFDEVLTPLQRFQDERCPTVHYDDYVASYNPSLEALSECMLGEDHNAWVRGYAKGMKKMKILAAKAQTEAVKEYFQKEQLDVAQFLSMNNEDYKMHKEALLKYVSVALQNWKGAQLAIQPRQHLASRVGASALSGPST